MKESVFIEYSAEISASSDLPHINGADNLAPILKAGLEKHGHNISQDDLWNDFGWYIVCDSSGIEFALLLAKYESDADWQLTIEPNKLPSIFRRLLGAKQLPYIGAMRTLTDDVYRIVSEIPSTSNVRLCLKSDTKLRVENPNKLPWKSA